MELNCNDKMIDKKDPSSENSGNQSSYTEEDEEEVSEEGKMGDKKSFLFFSEKNLENCCYFCHMF